MARPIKETPVVYGKDAIRILKEIENPKPLSAQRQTRLRKAMELYSEIHKNSYEEAGIVMTKEGFKVLK